MATLNWLDTNLGTSPVNTPRYSNAALVGDAAGRGQPSTNYAGTMARLYFKTPGTQDTTPSAVWVLEAGLMESIGGGYIDFLLQTANHSFSENVAVSETLDDLYSAYSFGRAPPTFTYTAVLINSKQENQAHKFTLMYNELIRANRLAHNQQLVYLFYDGYEVGGYLTGFNMSLRAEDESHAVASFQMLVKSFSQPKIDEEVAVVATRTAPDPGTAARLLGGYVSNPKAKGVITTLTPTDAAAARAKQ